MNTANKIKICFNTIENNRTVKIDADSAIKNIINSSTITKINETPIDLSLDNLAQNMFSDIKKIFVELHKLKLLPDLGKPLTININNINTTDRKLNYTDNFDGLNLPYETIPHTLDTDIFLPLDIYDSIGKEQILNGNNYLIGDRNFLLGHLYSSEEKNISSQMSNLTNILTHELGHYYFSILYPTKEISEKINSQTTNNKCKEQLISWYKNLHEGFADSWAIALNYRLNKSSNLSILTNDNLIDYLATTREKNSDPKYNLDLVYSTAKNTNWGKCPIVDTCINLSYNNSIEFLHKNNTYSDIHPLVLNTLNNFESKFNIAPNSNFLQKIKKSFWDKDNMHKRINSITSQQRSDPRFNESNNFGQLKIPK